MEEEARFLASFDKAPEFFDALTQFLAVDLQHEPKLEENQKEGLLLNKLTLILQEYHEQSYLLDPFLERMVTPVVEVLKGHVAYYTTAGSTASYSSPRLFRLTTLLYNFFKCRGRKTIVNFFPHQVSDLPIALQYLGDPKSPCQLASQWSLRYSLLLWLSLICMIPFDLARFDMEPVSENISSTATRIQLLADVNLSRAGVEREAAAILLCKLYAREDSCILLPSFIHDSKKWLGETPDYFKTVGILHVFSEILKSGIPTPVAPYIGAIRDVLNQISSMPNLLSNILVRKYRAKLEGRMAAGLIPTSSLGTARKGKTLNNIDSSDESSAETLLHPMDENIEIPEEVENTISILLNGLQDKDTSVRYSAAKHLARISERLPSFLSEQILDNVLYLFSAHLPSSKKMEDLPPISEPTWQGACLACAEMARRGLIADSFLKELLDWLQKALVFDIRQGAHSVGSSVRDAAAYVIWALARAQGADTLKPYALHLAQRLVSVSLFDREVQIRRAASAAFQENVGRLSLFPHGIDIIRKADFFSVGIRKNSFLVAAPQVAIHEEYRAALIDHIVSRTLIHWDPSMRLLGAQSLRCICEIDLETLALLVQPRLLTLLRSIDLNEVHGGLLGLSELAAGYKASGKYEEERLKLLQEVNKFFEFLLQKRSIEHPLSAACQFIANSVSLAAIASDKPPHSQWRKVIDQGLRHRNTEVQEAAAVALQELSNLTDCSNEIKRFVREFSKASPALQQSLAHAFGLLAYDKYEHAVHDVLGCLFDAMNPSSSIFSSNVEARRNCCLSLPDILCKLDQNILSLKDYHPGISIQVLQTLITGLQDYTVDERGDVGSWIRMACIRGLSLTIQFLFDLAERQEAPSVFLELCLPLDLYHEAIGGILKQGVERLDNVRRHAGIFFLQLLKKLRTYNGGYKKWHVDGYPFFEELFLRGEEMGWNDGEWLFPRAVRLLDIPTYRRQILYGLVLSIGSKTDGTQRPVAKYLADYVDSLPVTIEEPPRLDLAKFNDNVFDLAKKNHTHNQVVIPVLQTFDVLLEGGILSKLGDSDAGKPVLQGILDLATKNTTRLKNVQRIICSMKIVNGMLSIPAMCRNAAASISKFLLHPFPRVRIETAEHLYMVMQAKDFGFDTEDAENILLEMDWSVSINELESNVTRLVALLQNGP